MPPDFTLKFIDGTPVPADYAEKLAAFNRSVWECDITEEDELIMRPYRETPTPDDQEQTP